MCGGGGRGERAGIGRAGGGRHLTSHWADSPRRDLGRGRGARGRKQESVQVMRMRGELPKEERRGRIGRTAVDLEVVGGVGQATIGRHLGRDVLRRAAEGLDPGV